ncbi:MAG: glycerol-3-phosphate 1-O-acyltransferase PlsY [Burkholderiales bacterium]|nr:glycerol-3-phosphate 1-O-acyltransferase PlsY [Burkholderiales bacterium]
MAICTTTRPIARSPPPGPCHWQNSGQYQNSPCHEQGRLRSRALDSLSATYPVLAAVAAYLLGSLSFAVIVSRVMGLNDPRSYGSKNPGATNVLRSGSRKAAVLTLLLDGAKGWLPVALVQWYGKPYGLEAGTVALVGLGAFLGHLYPVFFRFEGGKGVATAAGVLLGVHWALGLATLGTWVIIALFFRYSSLAALVAAVFAPLYYIFGDGLAWYMEGAVLFTVSLMSLLLIYRHAENIGRLARGVETRLGQKKKP